MLPQAAPALVLDHSLEALHPLDLQVLAALAAVPTPRPLMLAATAASPAAARAAVAHPSLAAPQAQAEQEGRAS
jgi:hypothetical protein